MQPLKIEPGMILERGRHRIAIRGLALCGGWWTYEYRKNLWGRWGSNYFRCHDYDDAHLQHLLTSGYAVVIKPPAVRGEGEKA